jgi:DNA-directed RNA polymerase specialized sigma24 family protein
MRYGANMSCEQIAKALSITVGTVTSRLCRGNRMLRTTLQGLMDETGQHKVQAPPSAPSGRDTDAQ